MVDVRIAWKLSMLGSNPLNPPYQGALKAQFQPPKSPLSGGL